LLEISRQKENIKYQEENEHIYQDDELKLIDENLNNNENYSYLNILPNSGQLNDEFQVKTDLNSDQQNFSNNETTVILNNNNNNNNNDYLDFNESKIKDLKHEHVININSGNNFYKKLS
jgi:hypothetical protein